MHLIEVVDIAKGLDTLLKPEGEMGGGSLSQKLWKWVRLGAPVFSCLPSVPGCYLQLPHSMLGIERVGALMT